MEEEALKQEVLFFVDHQDEPGECGAVPLSVDYGQSRFSRCSHLVTRHSSPRRTILQGSLS